MDCFKGVKVIFCPLRPLTICQRLPGCFCRRSVHLFIEGSFALGTNIVRLGGDLKTPIIIHDVAERGRCCSGSAGRVHPPPRGYSYWRGVTHAHIQRAHHSTDANSFSILALCNQMSPKEMGVQNDIFNGLERCGVPYFTLPNCK